MEEVIITGYSNITKEGIVLHFNKSTKQKGSKGLSTNEWWVSWDTIGKAMFEGYTEKDGVLDRRELRGESNG